MLTYKIIHIYIINQVIYDGNCDMNGGLVLLLARRKMTRSYQRVEGFGRSQFLCHKHPHFPGA